MHKSLLSHSTDFQSYISVTTIIFILLVYVKNLFRVYVKVVGHNLKVLCHYHVCKCCKKKGKAIPVTKSEGA
jgi:hypothetical protein